VGSVLVNVSELTQYFRCTGLKPRQVCSILMRFRHEDPRVPKGAPYVQRPCVDASGHDQPIQPIEFEYKSSGLTFGAKEKTMLRRTLFVWVSFMVILGGFRCEIYAQQPKPHLSIYGSGGPVHLAQTEIPKVTLAPAGNSRSKQIGPAGGSISIQDGHGDQITLTIPEDALGKPTTITLTVPGSPPQNPIGTNLFPGVIIQPDGLMLREPAALDVVFASPLLNPKLSSLLYLKQSDFVVPIGRQNSSTSEIRGEIYHFSTYFGGQPSGVEAGAQAGQIPCSPNPRPSNWQFTFENVYGLLEWADLLQALGKDAQAQQHIDAAKSILKADAADFLSLPVPSNPCEDYATSLFKYAEAVMALIGAGPLETQFQDRINNTVNRCSFRGSIDVIFVYALYHPGDLKYSVTITVPFHVEVYRPPYTRIVGGGGAANVSAREAVQDCPIHIAETYNIKNLGGKLIVDNQGNLLLDFIYQTNNSGEYRYSCNGITIPLGGSEWSDNEVTLPVIDGYEYVYSPNTSPRFKLHIKALP
jgi:hypothetical protein